MDGSMRIAAMLYQSAYADQAHPVFTINGVVLNIWLHKQTQEKYVFDLAPAQGWLLDEGESALAWQLLRKLDVGDCAIVPLLVCTDDMDLNCSVISVEQCVTADAVIWQRFAWGFNNGTDTDLNWLSTPTSVSFEKAEFMHAVEEFQRLLDEL